MASINLQGDTSGAITISAPSVAGSNTLTLPATTQTLATQNALGVRNLIINGDMSIAQRGTSATGLGNNDTGYHTVDRWGIWENGSPTYEFTQTQDTDVPTGQGFGYSLKMQCTTADAALNADDAFAFRYKIEGQMLQHLKYGTSNAEQITMSFWVKSNKTGTYIVNPWASSEISKAYTIDSANTWEKKTITFDANTIDTISNNNATGLTIYMYMLAGTDRTSGTLNTTWSALTTANRVVGQVNLADSTSNYINITGVQLEVGDTATPFEHRPYDMELKRCSRYYQKTFRYSYAPYTTDNENRMYFTGMANTSTVIGNPGVRPIYQEGKMRTAPTITLYDTSGNSGKLTYTRAGQPASSNITAIVDQVGENAFRLSTSSASSLTAGQAVILLFYYTADAEL